MSLGLEDLVIGDNGTMVKDKFNGNMGKLEDAIDDKAEEVHSHGYISTDGKLWIGGVRKDDFALFTDSEGRITGELKKTAFNKAFGTTYDDVARGNHGHNIAAVDELATALALKADKEHTHIPSDITGLENIALDASSVTANINITGNTSTASPSIRAKIIASIPLAIVNYEISYRFKKMDGTITDSENFLSNSNMVIIPKPEDNHACWDDNGDAKIDIYFTILNPVNGTSSVRFEQENVAIKRYNSMDIPQLVDALTHSEAFIKAIAPVFAANPAFSSLVASQISEK